jgi:23S rRNA (adenine2503-C2)-methyltransferase
MGCGFCLTGKMGLVRNLTAGEIAGRCACLPQRLECSTTPFNIVLMGMGEPLHNYDNTMKALRMLHSEHGLAVSPRRVTLSTVGIVPGMKRLAQEALMPNLAISLARDNRPTAQRTDPAESKVSARPRFSRRAGVSR